eukprot:scaffold803_cov310-Pinguiococcus_pyrenoidosus.AAC.140
MAFVARCASCQRGSCELAGLELNDLGCSSLRAHHPTVQAYRPKNGAIPARAAIEAQELRRASPGREWSLDKMRGPHGAQPSRYVGVQRRLVLAQDVHGLVPTDLDFGEAQQLLGLSDATGRRLPRKRHSGRVYSVPLVHDVLCHSQREEGFVRADGARVTTQQAMLLRRRAHHVAVALWVQLHVLVFGRCHLRAARRPFHIGLSEAIDFAFRKGEAIPL